MNWKNLLTERNGSKNAPQLIMPAIAALSLTMGGFLLGGAVMGHTLLEGLIAALGGLVLLRVGVVEVKTFGYNAYYGGRFEIERNDAVELPSVQKSRRKKNATPGLKLSGAGFKPQTKKRAPK